MSEVDPGRRYGAAHRQALADWAAADPARRAAHAGCGLGAGGVLVPFFGRPLVVSHPGGRVGFEADPESAHVAVAILALHYLLRADDTPPARAWAAFRELPDGLFYAASFAARAEEPVARAFAAPAAGGEPGPERFCRAATKLGGVALGLADASFRFQALPRVPLAVLLWAGDEEFPAQAQVLFDAAAGHYLPAEDLAGLGGSLARKLTQAAG